MLSNESELAVEDEQLLSRRRAALMLDLSIETISRRIKSGELRAVHLGRLVRIPRSEIRRLIADSQVADIARLQA